MSKWITFLLSEEKPKTSVWRIETKDTHNILGFIKWLARWRKYAFFPNTDTIYENDCLRDIASFIEEKMYDRKMQRL